MRYNDLIDRIDGYIVGTLIVDNDDVYIQTNDGNVYADRFDILNGDTYESYMAVDACTMRDADGWPIMAGMYARARL